MARRGIIALVAAALTASAVPFAAYANEGSHIIENADAAPVVAEAEGRGPLSLSGARSTKCAVKKGAARRAMANAGVRGAHDPNAAVAPLGRVYQVSTISELDSAMEQIAAADDAEATIQLAADLRRAQDDAGKPFAGVPGKTVMLSSVDGARHEVYVASELVGGLVLDNVDTDIEQNTIYANAHPFETTDRYSGAMSFLYGGGSAGNDVTGDCHIVLRGGYVAQFYGGGRDSNVDGSVSITIDAPVPSGSLPQAQSVNNFHGGGHAYKTDQGRISGDVTVNFLSGSNAAFFGGGNNEFDRDAMHVANPAAMVSGTVTVNLGYAGAPFRSVWPGLAMYTYAGSEYSTVGNVRLNVLEGCTDNGDRNFYGCGYNDTVLGTVEVVVEGAVDLDSGFVHYGGDTDEGYYVDGNVGILNRGQERNAVSVRWNVPASTFEGSSWTGVQANEEEVPLTVEGDVFVDIQSGYLAFVKLDSETSSAVINGDSTIYVGGDAKIAQIEGNEREYSSEEQDHRTRVVFDGVNATVGYCYLFDEVSVAAGSTVLIDAAPDVFPMFGSTQKPFYSVDYLVVDGASQLTTRNSDTMVMRDVQMDNGTWHAKGRVYVYGTMDTRESSIMLDTYYQIGFGHKDDADPSLVTSWRSSGDTLVAGYTIYLNKIHGNVEATGGTWSLLSRTGVRGDFTARDLTLQLPVIAEGANYPAKSIPLAIDGVSSGHADVVTVSRAGLSDDMDASAWVAEPVVPVLTESYITSWAPEGVGNEAVQDNPAQAVFTLDPGVQGADAYFLKRLPDADVDYADSYYMWQVADGFAVRFDKNTTDEGATDADPAYVAVPSNPGDAVALGTLPVPPTRPGYVFDGWYANPEGTGDPVNEDTMIDNDVTFYAKWVKEVAPKPDPEPLDHTVTFIDRVPGHENQVDVVDHGKTEPKPADPVRPGYTFGGWFVDSACTEPFDFSTPILQDVVLYAKWTPATPTADGKPAGSTTHKPSGMDGTGAPAGALPATGDVTALFAMGGSVLAAMALGAASSMRARARRGE